MSGEFRLIERLITYWGTIKKSRDLPNINHFNPAAIADLWDNCILFTVVPSGSKGSTLLQFHQVGDRVRQLYENEMVGQIFTTEQRHFAGASIVQRIGESIATHDALTDKGVFVNDRGKVVKYRSCLLPFGTHDKVTHVIVGLSWREF